MLPGNGYGSYGGFDGYGSAGSSTYQDEESMRRRAAANYVQSGHYQEAMNVLNSLGQKNGEWYYLAALANMGLGNNVTALDQIREAVRQEPNNMRIAASSENGRRRRLVPAATGSVWRNAHSRGRYVRCLAAELWPVPCAGRAEFSAVDKNAGFVRD